LHRKEHRFEPDSAKAETVAKEFIAACNSGDLDRLVLMMADDVTLYSDGGGKVAAARRPIEVAVNVARFLISVTKTTPPGLEIKAVVVNGRPGVAVLQNGVPIRVFSLELDAAGLQTICVVGNPDKLQHLGMGDRRLPAAPERLMSARIDL
jgi:RNA polymerase sigma-70 factor (ECF subfamily)